MARTRSQGLPHPTTSAPQLLRAGLAETLSSVNGDLVERIEFHVADLRRLTKDLQTSGDFSPEYDDEQGLLAWGTEKFGVDLFGLRGRSAFALQPEGWSLRYDCGTNPADPPRGPCDQFNGSARGFEQFAHDLDLVDALRLQLASHHLRRSEREDTDDGYVADWIPNSSRPGPSPVTGCRATVSPRGVCGKSARNGASPWDPPKGRAGNLVAAVVEWRSMGPASPPIRCGWMG